MMKFNQLDMGFFIGNEVPNVDKINQIIKIETYYLVLSDRSIKRIDLQALVQEHPETLADWSLLGYYTNLVVDVVWLTDIFVKVISSQDNPERSDRIASYCEGFQKLNPA